MQEYDGLRDRHLNHFFQTKFVKKVLRKTGLKFEQSERPRLFSPGLTARTERIEPKTERSKSPVVSHTSKVDYTGFGL